MQLKQALASAVERLEAADVGSPRMNAETLLMFVLGSDRAYLYAHPERELTPEEEARYNEVLAQRATGIPSQYITGHQEFWGLDFVVSPAVLIPRPETEHLVEAVLELARGMPHPKIVDVGTGSGCVALALAHELKDAEIYGVDLSAEALEIARANAARLQLDTESNSCNVMFSSPSTINPAPNGALSSRARTSVRVEGPLLLSVTSISWSAIRLTSPSARPTRSSIGIRIRAQDGCLRRRERPGCDWSAH